MSEGINTHWLMHYRVVALVNQCRQELDRFAARSQSRELARLMDDIAREAGAADAPPEPEKTAPKRMYRGQPLPEPASETEPGRAASPKAVIYRGRQVRG